MTAAEKFDLMNPDLPDSIKKNAISSGNYPYDKRMGRKKYERQLLALQFELRKLQAHIRKNRLRLVILFEGRDAAGKGGTIKRFMQHLNPRHAHVVALSKPTETERGQWYFQRYTCHLPTAEDISLFDRSWYNRAGVEPVMGFCTPEQTQRFLIEAPAFEKMLVRDGIHLFKFWLTIGREMQLKRFHDRQHNPLKVWKVSPIDLKAIDNSKRTIYIEDQAIASTEAMAHLETALQRGVQIVFLIPGEANSAFATARKHEHHR